MHGRGSLFLVYFGGLLSPSYWLVSVLDTRSSRSRSRISHGNGSKNKSSGKPNSQYCKKHETFHTCCYWLEKIPSMMPFCNFAWLKKAILAVLLEFSIVGSSAGYFLLKDEASLELT